MHWQKLSPSHRSILNFTQQGYLMNSVIRATKSRPIKAERFDYLVQRSDLAIREEFYLEASWICYAIIEDRIRSVFIKLDGEVKKNDKIYHCIKNINARRNAHPILDEYFPTDLLDRIDNWRIDRNNLMHELVDSESESIEFKGIAIAGRALVKELKGNVRKFKTKLKKEGLLA